MTINMCEEDAHRRRCRRSGVCHRKDDEAAAAAEKDKWEEEPAKVVVTVEEEAVVADVPGREGNARDGMPCSVRSYCEDDDDDRVDEVALVVLFVGGS